MQRRADYRPPSCHSGLLELHIELGARETRIRARYVLDRNPAAHRDEPVVLHWRSLDVVRLMIDGEPQSVKDMSGEIAVVPTGDRFTVETEVVLQPDANESLQGLYQAGTALVTHCEPEGFRRIIPFPDRPDILVRIETTLSADKASYPVLLSNGECDGAGEIDAHRHWVRWRDVVPKPCYLFALAAGPFTSIEDRHVTRSGRQITIAAHVLNGPADRARFALDCLKSVMEWEEAWLGREFDLDTYNLAIFSPLAFHAMENKGLNFFDDSVGLIDADAAIDLDYLNVEINVAHEYLHNLTGNRVPCRDWFELCLKEGLTTLRHQLYAEAKYGPSMRLWPLKVFQSQQLPEDLGASARPARPEEYAEPFNLYTPTAYIKSSEIFRMISELIGPRAFTEGLKAFLQNFDGRPARLEDILAHLGKAAGVSLDDFLEWFEVPGALTVDVRPMGAEAELGAGWAISKLSSQEDRRPLPLGRFESGVVGIGVEVDAHGMAMMRGTRAELAWPGDGRSPTPLFNEVSVPVIVREERTDTALGAVLIEAADPCQRWMAAQKLAGRAVGARLANDSRDTAAETYAEALASVLDQPASDPALVAELITLPEPRALFEPLEFPDPLELHAAWADVRRFLGGRLADRLIRARAKVASVPEISRSPQAIAARMLGNAALELWLASGDPDAETSVRRVFLSALSPNQEVAAFRMLFRTKEEADEELVERAHIRWRNKPALWRRWFEIQAMRPASDTVEVVAALLKHDGFDMADVAMVRTMCSAFFINNQRGFHDASGNGYGLLQSLLCELDQSRPVLAAWLLRSTDMVNWQRFGGSRRDRMYAVLNELHSLAHLSPELGEILGRILVTAKHPLEGAHTVQ